MLIWWVATVDQGAELERALAELWPEAQVDVRVGEGRGQGVWVDEEEELVLRWDGTTRRAAVPSIDAQVVLVRSWMVRSEEGGWRPRLDPNLRRVPLYGGVGGGLGPGLGLAGGGGPLHLVVGGDGGWRALRWAGGLDADLGATAADQDGRPVRVQRVTGTARVGLGGELWGGEVRFTTGPGVVLVAVGDAGTTEVLAYATLTESLGWAAPVRPGWEAAVGLRAAVDDPARALEPLEVALEEGSTVQLVRLRMAIEVTVARTGRWR